MYSIRCERCRARAKAAVGAEKGRWAREVSGAVDGEGLALSSERAQKEGSGRCAADAGRKVRERNEKECNKLAVRLFSTCIKTSSGATDDLESIARHFLRPSIGPLSSPRERHARPHHGAADRAWAHQAQPTFLRQTREREESRGANASV